MKVLGIIPARFAALRFPGKPLANIDGISMIQRVYQQAEKSSALSKLIVATDDDRIYNHVKSFGGEVMMTSQNCQNGTERCVEVVHNVDDDFDLVINIQGDEPLLNPEQLNQLVDLLDKESAIATLAHHLTSEEKDNPNIVKVALSNQNFALAFSRSFEKAQLSSNKIYKHIGLYGFQNKVLQQITTLNKTENEKSEKLEQLRWLDNNYQIKIGLTPHQNFSVDVPDDITKILRLLNSEV